MVTDQQIRRLYKLSNTEKTQEIAASKAGMDVKTGRKYLRARRLPSEMKTERHWRTRTDLFEEVWPGIQEQFRTNPGLDAKTVFAALQRQYPERFADGQLRTLQRKVKNWRATEGPAQEVYFVQEHRAGELCASDFTHLTELAITIGAVAATIVSYSLARYAAPTVAWRWMFASVIVPVGAFSVLLIRVPASPRWLAEKNRFDEALAVLTQIAGKEEAQKELQEMRATMQAEAGSLRELFQPGMRAALFTGIILAVRNNWTGWTGIAFYLPTLFQRAGFANASDAIAQNVLVMGGTVFLTLISIWLVDRVGRRPLWIICSIAMCVFLVLTGMVFQFNATGHVVVLMIFLCAAPLPSVWDHYHG